MRRSLALLLLGLALSGCTSACLFCESPHPRFGADPAWPWPAPPRTCYQSPGIIRCY